MIILDFGNQCCSRICRSRIRSIVIFVLVSVVNLRQSARFPLWVGWHARFHNSCQPSRRIIRAVFFLSLTNLKVLPEREKRDRTSPLKPKVSQSSEHELEHNGTLHVTPSRPSPKPRRSFQSVASPVQSSAHNQASYPQSISPGGSDVNSASQPSSAYILPTLVSYLRPSLKYCFQWKH